MNKLAAIAVAVATVATVSLNTGVASARSSSSTATGAWPTVYPLPTSSGTVVWQSSVRAAVRSTDTVTVVKNELDNLYVTQLGCTAQLVVNKPKDYLCSNPVTGQSNEVYFTFAALDPTATDLSRTQANAFLG